VLFTTLGAPRGARFRRSRPQRAEPGAAEPDSVPISRVTVIEALGFDDEQAAESWLERCRKDEEFREQATETALRVANRAIHAHRLSAADPYVHEVTRERTLTVLLGYGTGDEVVEGRWQAAYRAPPPRARRGRRQMLAPQEQVAAILSGRRPARTSEDMVLRARLDFDHHRIAQAALELRAALEALRSESADEGAHPLKDREAQLDGIVSAALRDGLDDSQKQALGDALTEAERAVRRLRHLPE
jgi:hypothetical protein